MRHPGAPAEVLLRGLERVVLVAAWLATLTGVARADDRFGFRGGHMAYGIGGAFAAQQPGFRHNLDLGLAVGWYSRTGSSIPLWDNEKGTVLAPWSSIGFGKYPTYVGVEYGVGEDHGIIGGSYAIGPALRFGSDRFDKGAGLACHLTLDLLFLQGGLRTIAILTHPQEAQLTFTLGAGRF